MRKHRKKGFTIAELMIVVAMMTLLGGAAFVGIARYQRTLAQTERDSTARELFVAAQNHLTMAGDLGYLSMEKYGAESKWGADEGKNIYYFVVNGGDAFTGDTALDLMLPFGSIDEAARTGGSYIIRYQTEPALVLDVFYCSRGDRYRHTIDAETDYENYMNELRDVPASSGVSAEDRKSVRGNYNGYIVGWYGGEEAARLEVKKNQLTAPVIEVTNAERLYVTITDPNPGEAAKGYEHSLVLVMLSADGERKASVKLKAETGATADSGANIGSETVDGKMVYTVVLDDITEERLRFGKLFSDFKPGENIVLQATVYSNSVLTNIASTAEVETNSLFMTVDNKNAYIGYVRHLENLDTEVSGLAADITGAIQTTDLSWTGFQAEIKKEFLGDPKTDVKVYYTEKDAENNEVSKSTASGCFKPVTSVAALDYDGQGHSISKVNVSWTGDAGLFGTVSGGSLENLQLIDFTVAVTNGNAGALAGTVTDSATVTNVLARNSGGDRTDTVTATGTSCAAGGLVGVLEASTVKASAAALCVSSAGDAGGLIGTAKSKEINGATRAASIQASYAGGHTVKGAFYDDSNNPIYNVTGYTAGGLVGTASSTAISYCYATCSVSGGNIAGGLVGVAGGTISNSYAAGLVGGDAATRGAFAGSLSGGATDCRYFMIINESKKDGGGYEYMAPVSGSETVSGITALDEKTDTKTGAQVYDEFVEKDGKWTSASAYDATLVQYYRGAYNLRSVVRLGADLTGVTGAAFAATHYGDWPAPELMFAN